MAHDDFTPTGSIAERDNAYAYKQAYATAKAERSRLEEALRISENKLQELREVVSAMEIEVEAHRGEPALFLRFAKKAFPGVPQ